MYKRNILIADDHPLVREAVTKLLETDFQIDGTASDGRSLIEMAERHRPLAVVLDISLPGLNGLEAARHLTAMLPNVKIIFYSLHNHPDYVQEAFNSGASAYVCKTSSTEELLEGVRAACRGMQYVSVPGIVSRTVFHKSRKSSTSTMFRGLTLRQREVLQLLAEGNSAKIVAAKLNISARTVEFHKASMLNVLKIKSTAELIRYAVESGIVGTPNTMGIKLSDFANRAVE